jgi:hypothetical protein
MTGGRLKRVKDYAGKGTFHMTYGDGVSDVDLRALTAFHRKAGRAATVTAVRPPGRFGSLEIKGDRVSRFQEKPRRRRRIRGYCPGTFGHRLIEGDATFWELPMERLAARGHSARTMGSGIDGHCATKYLGGRAAPWLVRGHLSSSPGCRGASPTHLPGLTRRPIYVWPDAATSARLLPCTPSSAAPASCQIGECRSPQAIFEITPISPLSPTAVAHAEALLGGDHGAAGPGAESLVVELASNDGYLLKNWARYPRLGVEPPRTSRRSPPTKRS